MKGKTLNEFIETLHLGFDMEFEYAGKKYVIGGFTENGKNYIELNEYIPETIFDDNILSNHYKYIIEGNSFDECVSKILKAKLIDGKTLYELEKDIIVIYG